MRSTPPTDDGPSLSVVLPWYRSAALAETSARRLAEFLTGVGASYEIVVVDDGGGDFRPDAFADRDDVRLVRLERNRGKGAAVRAGMLAARGDVRVFTDVDLPYDLDLIVVMRECIVAQGYHLVIGDRTLPGSAYAEITSGKRRAASALFSAFVGRVVTGGFFDTQCGLKALRGDLADLMFPLLQIDRFAFDVELVYLALKHRLDIKRIPVQLRNNQTSTVRLFRDSSRGVADVFRIKYHHLRGHYRGDAIDQVLQSEFVEMRSRVGREVLDSSRIGGETSVMPSVHSR
jgi:glycosyltransferase involved in cell wall biosynthesis